MSEEIIRLTNKEKKICEACDKYYQSLLTAEKLMDSKGQMLEGRQLEKYKKLIFNLNICVKKGWSIVSYEQRHRHDEEKKNEN